MAVLGSAVTWPLAARAQQARRTLPTIGFLGTGTPASHGPWIVALERRLREHGWVEGDSVAIDYRWAEGRVARFGEIAGEFAALKVDVIVTTGGAVLPAMKAASDIPIVFGAANDPVGAGMVASLARPGGNVTGLSMHGHGTASKRVELLHELVPGLRRMAIMANVAYPATVLEMQEAQTAARRLGLETTILEIRRAEDIVTALEAFKGGADALYVCTETLVVVHRVRLGTLALGARLPTIHGFRDMVEAGGLVSYGPNFPALFSRAADYVDKILRGANPADLPVEQPTVFDLVINLSTARALGLTVPPVLLARADEVIE
jgi:putative ABC transport system substrate-binding protein